MTLTLDRTREKDSIAGHIFVAVMLSPGGGESGGEGSQHLAASSKEMTMKINETTIHYRQ